MNKYANMIISFLNQKGGVGKTTLATNVAFYLSEIEQKKVLLIDSDPQNSALDWATIRQTKCPFTIISITRPIIHTEVKKLKDDYDYIIIDGAPRIHDVARSVIVASDLILIPIQPSPYDCWAAKEIIDLFKEVSITISEIKEIKAAFIVNRKIPNTIIGKDINVSLKTYNIDILENQVCQRICYAESASIGNSILENTSNNLAKEEIINLTKEIINKYRFM